VQANGSLRAVPVAAEREHAAIRRRLVKGFKYYDTQRAAWRPITNFADPECTDSVIQLRCKFARQELRVPYPFRLEDAVLYLWGLVAGAASGQKQLEICVDAAQEPILEAITAKLGISITIQHVRKRRRTRGSQRAPNPYRKIRVVFPFVVKQFLAALGYQPADNALPQWVGPDQQLRWLEGYLNSKKTQCTFRKGGAFFPRLRIYVSQDDPRLLADIQALLDECEIAYQLYRYAGQYRITIQNRASLLALADRFAIQRPNIQALFALLRRCATDPALRVTLQKFKLSQLQLLLYGLVLAQPLTELEYTLFEETLACSSNDIRQNLYLLDQLGLIAYYKKDNNKEFLIQAQRYLHSLRQILAAEEEELRRQLKVSDSSVLSFHCPDCGAISSYLDALQGDTFACPHCASATLAPLEVSQYFYYGHLGHLVQQKSALPGGPL
jgi:predicted RNA-binding Zn-ribbon protein involved in translation (DUF1610 family)